MDGPTARHHLAEVHGVDWADDLDQVEKDRLHHAVHQDRPLTLYPINHSHDWAGTVADPTTGVGDHGHR